MKGFVTFEKWDQILDDVAKTPTGEWHAVGTVTVRVADIAEVFTVSSLGLTQIALTGGGFHKQVITKMDHMELLAEIAKASAEPLSGKRAA